MTYNNPFVVYLTIYSGNKLPPFYIGSTNIKKIHNGYYGSPTSKQYKTIWRSELKNNPHLFKIKIISSHNSRQVAADKESKLQTILQVHKNPLYINMAFWLSGHVNYGRLHSAEARKKISTSRKGKYLGVKQSKEHIDNRFKNIRKNGKVVSEHTRHKLSLARKGKPAHNKGKPMPQHLKDNLSLKRRKYVYTIVDQQGYTFITDNLKDFCSKHNFTTAQKSNLRSNYRNGFTERRSNGYKIIHLDHI